jgi:hypothetical protein
LTLVALGLALGLSGAHAAQAAPDLAGRWAIEPGASDEGGRRPEPGGESPRRIGGAPPGAFPEETQPAGALPEGIVSGGQNGANPAAVLKEFGASPEELVFGRDPDGTLTLDDGNTVARLYADGRRFKRANGLLETIVRQKDGALVLESQPSGGGIKVTVAYALDAQDHLIVDATLKPPQGKAMKRRRVYKRVS